MKWITRVTDCTLRARAGVPMPLLAAGSERVLADGSRTSGSHGTDAGRPATCVGGFVKVNK